MTLAQPIRLKASPSTIALLYGSAAKIVVPSSDASWAARRPWKGDIEALGYLAAASASDGCARLFRFEDGEENAEDITVPPSGPCLLVSASASGREEIAELEAWWLHRGVSAPDRVDFSDRPVAAAHSDGEIVAIRLLRLISAELARVSTAAARMHGEISALRQEIEVSGEKLRAHRELLASVGGDRTHLAAAFTAIGESIGAPAEEGLVVAQPLPMAMRGLTAFDLFCTSAAESSPASGGVLQVDLIALETDKAVACWEAPYDEFIPGWMRFSLPVSLADPLYDFEVRLTWRSAHGPRVGLASTNGLKAFSLRGAPTDDALALLVWTGLPGAEHTKMPTGPRHFGAAPSVMEFDLASNTFHHVEPTGPEMPSGFCRPLGEGPGLLLHPLAGGRWATAVLRSVCPPGTDRILSSVRVGNTQAASEVEFAACVLPAGRYHEFPEDPRTLPDLFGFSGWMPVPVSGETVAIAIDFPAPAAGPGDLHLATRVLPDRSNANCWAEWTGVRIRLQLAACRGRTPHRLGNAGVGRGSGH